MASALRLGVAGLGTVGASLVRLLTKNGAALARKCGRPVVLTAVSARDRTRDRGVDLSGFTWFDDPVELARSGEIDVFVELIGGASGPAEASVRAAIASGKHVVTANKALLARHGVELAGLAERAGVSLNYEAAVAGGIPIVKTLREAMAGNSVARVYGILNGTCNYILTRMEREGLSFAECLADAQRLGYAEADPTFDIEGNDTAHKLALLTSLAFGCKISADDIYLEGITSITTADIRAADELGYRIKLLGVAQKTDSGIEQRVHPTMVPKSSAIARIDGVLNAVAVDGDFVGEIVLVGPGAGGDATASSVASDIADIARGDVAPALGSPSDELVDYTRAGMRRHEGGYYIRLSVFDRPGAFATIARAMADANISLESIVQRRAEAPGLSDRGAGEGTEPQPVILITYETTEAAVKEALEAIVARGVVADAPQMIRIEKLA
ncbi:homoserine dehydrogenase [Microvirga tunisiensis]|uniref:Homoserine dehydrogenase n=2 Tax=Pannonibacter tanglangensis TaxID=2750084 RepID=A0A7X5F1N6_9HYPH|nr:MULTISPECIES: homoserine dehydrogenase [unclassified Pannonibacter]NBN62482.1 homoserine dehydrogenase [Pannonibacter sp. XCT-34]NBN78138.1 homoserine dehydrogenase [Pannonibacter sp. XCT-53]